MPGQCLAERFQTISIEEILALQQSESSFLLINALSPIEFNELHIKDSVNIPASHVDRPHPLLPVNKNTTLIFYCKGIRCTKSRLAARKAMGLGYNKVLIFSGGIPAWQKAGLPVTSHITYPEIPLQIVNPLQVYQQQEPFILDIRGKEVSLMGNIAGAVKIPLDDLMERADELPCDRTIIIIDHAGQQSPICARYLHTRGYISTHILEGGMINWISQGFPTR
jgi:rhodanese-related sulfurtransferase